MDQIKITHDEVHFELSSGKKIMLDVEMIGVIEVEVGEINIDNLNVLVNGDWDKTDLTAEESVELDKLLNRYADSVYEI